MVSPFWSEPCPARGAGLNHAHWSRCTPEAHPGEESGHMPFQCCHCRGLDPRAQATSWPPQNPPLPPIDVIQRLRAMGFTGPIAVIQHMPGEEPDVSEQDTGMEDIHADFDEDAPREPRMITGEGPKGRLWGPGRFHLPGELTARDMKSLIGYTGFRDWLARHGGGEE